MKQSVCWCKLIAHIHAFLTSAVSVLLWDPLSSVFHNSSCKHVFTSLIWPPALSLATFLSRGELHPTSVEKWHFLDMKFPDVLLQCIQMHVYMPFEVSPFFRPRWMRQYPSGPGWSLCSSFCSRLVFFVFLFVTMYPFLLYLPLHPLNLRNISFI